MLSFFQRFSRAAFAVVCLMAALFLLAIFTSDTAEAQRRLQTMFGGTGTTSVFTEGSVVFVGNSDGYGSYAQDNTNFFWDNTDKRLGLGTNTPSVPLDVVGAIAATGSVSGAVLVAGQAALTSDSGAVTFNAAAADSFKITLTENTVLTLSSAAAGQQIAAIVCQDNSGSHTFTWDAAMLGAVTVGATAETCSAQRFLCDGTNCYALSAGATGM